MIRFLKYIFLVFGLLAISIAGFFAYNNRVDLKRAYAVKNIISFDYAKNNCPEVKEKLSSFPCLKLKLDQYFSDVSLTGISIGLKFAFNFLDEDRENSHYEAGEKFKEFIYTLHYLELNNMAIKQSTKRYFGFSFMYSGYIGSLERFSEKSFEFSENLIKGLRSKEGIQVLKEPELVKSLNERLLILEKEYLNYKEETKSFINQEIKRLTEASDAKN